MKGILTVSKNGNCFSSVEKCIAHSTVAHAMPLQLSQSRQCSPAPCRTDSQHQHRSTKAPSAGAKLKNAWYTCLEFARMVWMSLRELVSGNVGVKDLSGPVGIVDMMAETGQQAASVADALYSIFYFGAFIAVNLAVMNMLPITALDGGRVFLLLVTWVIETVTGKKLNPKYEGYIHAAGMVLLLALMAFVMLNDIIRIVTG